MPRVPVAYEPRRSAKRRREIAEEAEAWRRAMEKDGYEVWGPGIDLTVRGRRVEAIWAYRDPHDNLTAFLQDGSVRQYLRGEWSVPEGTFRFEPEAEEKAVFRWTSVAFNAIGDAERFQRKIESVNSTIVADLRGHIVTTNASGRDIDRVLTRNLWEKGYKVYSTAGRDFPKAAEGAACPPRPGEHEKDCGCGGAACPPRPGSMDRVARARAYAERKGCIVYGVVEDRESIVLHYKTADGAVGHMVVTEEVLGKITEARDSGPACKPFTRVETDQSRFNACMALAKRLGPLDSDKKLYAFLAPDLAREDQEVFVVVGLDINADLRVYSEVARGQRDRVQVSVEDILRPVLLQGCTAFAVAHNHPSGLADPSAEDGKLTDRIREASKAHPGLTFLDHLVIGQGSYYSFADRKLKRA
jgi:hypothetical protein